MDTLGSTIEAALVVGRIGRRCPPGGDHRRVLPGRRRSAGGRGAPDRRYRSSGLERSRSGSQRHRGRAPGRGTVRMGGRSGLWFGAQLRRPRPGRVDRAVPVPGRAVRRLHPGGIVARGPGPRPGLAVPRRPGWTHRSDRTGPCLFRPSRPRSCALRRLHRRPRVRPTVRVVPGLPRCRRRRRPAGRRGRRSPGRRGGGHGQRHHRPAGGGGASRWRSSSGAGCSTVPTPASPNGSRPASWRWHRMPGSGGSRTRRCWVPPCSASTPSAPRAGPKTASDRTGHSLPDHHRRIHNRVDPVLSVLCRHELPFLRTVVAVGRALRDLPPIVRRLRR